MSVRIAGKTQSKIWKFLIHFIALSTWILNEAILLFSTRCLWLNWSVPLKMEEYSTGHLVESNIQLCQTLYLPSRNPQLLTNLKCLVVVLTLYPILSQETVWRRMLWHHWVVFQLELYKCYDFYMMKISSSVFLEGVAALWRSLLHQWSLNYK